MPRRSLLTLLVLVSLVLVAVLVPRTPAGRGWLLERARDAAQSAGWTVDWRDSAGDPWRSVQLSGVRVQGPGVDATAGRAQVDWFALGLLTGDLPLWITIENADIAIDGQQLRGLGGGGAGGLPVRPDLRELSLRDVRVRVGDAPYTLPDLRLEDLEVDGAGTSIEASGRLASDDGALTFAADIGLSPFTVDADVRDADLRMARAWWRGVTGGTAQGTVAYGPEEGVTARLDVRSGSLVAARVEVDEVEGPVSLDAGLITSDLTGRSLSGPVAATVRVDVSNRRWSGSLRATPELEAVARWGVGDALPAALTPEGTALATATASGWTTVQVDGAVSAEGTLNDRPLELASDDVRYRSGEGLAFTSSGTALGGDLRVGAGVRDAALAWDVALDGAAFGPATELSGTARLRTGERLTGSFDASALIASPRPLGRVRLDGEIDGRTVSAFVEGAPEAGGSLEGALSVSGGEVRGAVRLRDTGPLAGEPVEVELRVDGPLADLPFALELRGDAPWRPGLPGLSTDVDLRGVVTGRYADLTLTDLDGGLGPIGVNGALALTAAADAEATPAPLRWSLAPTPVATGPARGVVAVRDGAFQPWRPDGSTLAGELLLTDAAASPARVETVSGTLTARLPWLAAGTPRDGIALDLDGDRLSASYEAGRIVLVADGVPLTVADAGGPLDADLSLDVARPLESLRGTASYRATGQAGLAGQPAAEELGEAEAAPGTVPTLLLDAGDAGLRLDAVLPAGTELSGLSLSRAVELRAALDATGAGEVRARAGSVALYGTVTGVAGDGGPALDAVLASGAAVDEGDAPDVRAADRASSLPAGADALRAAYPEASLATLRVTSTGSTAASDGPQPEATLDGELDLGAFAALAGVDAAGTLRADRVRLDPGGASGDALVTLTGPVPARVTWAAGTLDGTVPTPLGDVALSGTLRPGAPLSATLQHPWGQAVWREGTLRGGGTVPGRAWRDARLDAVPWTVPPTSLQAVAAGGDGLLVRIGDGEARWSDGRLGVRLDLPGAVADTPVRLQGDATVQPGTAPPTVRLAVVPEAGGDPLLRAEGTLGDLQVEADLPAATVADAARLGVAAQGTIEASGRLDLPAGRLDASGRWSAGDASLRLEVRRDDAPLRIALLGDALDLELGPDGAAFRAADASLGAFLPTLDGLIVDGALAVDPRDDAADAPPPLPTLDALVGGDWRGEVRVDVAELGSLVLTGRDGALSATGRWSGAGATVEIEGAITPALDLRVVGAHPGSGATLDATVAGPLPIGDVPTSSVTLTGALRIPDLAAQGYGLVATELRLGGTLDAPRLVGPTGEALRIEGGRLSGGLTLEARIAERPHVVDVRLDGPLSAPSATARLRGPNAQLDATLNAASDPPDDLATVSGSVDAGAWPPAAAGVAPGGATLQAGVRRDGRWSARVETELAPAGRPLSAVLVAEGSGLNGEADWRLAATDGVLLLGGEAALVDGLATLSADLSTLDAEAVGRWAGVRSRAEASGTVTASWRPSVSTSFGLEADVSVEGRVEGREVRIATSLAAGPEPGAAVLGRVHLAVDGDELTAQRAAGADAWTVQAAGSGYALSGRLAADATSATLEGTLADAPLELRAAREASGALLAVASWSGAQASLGVRPEPERWHATLDASVPARAGLPAAGTLSARGTFQDGTATLDRADLALLDPTQARADLAGRIWPDVALRGSLARVPFVADADGAPEPVALTASGSWDALTVRATTPGLTLALELDGAVPARLELRGEGREAAGVHVEPGRTGLAWERTGGWSGSATASWAATPGTSDPPSEASEMQPSGDADASATATATLTGQGEALAVALAGAVLRGAVTASLEADATLTGPPWNAGLDGTGQLWAEADVPGDTADTATDDADAARASLPPATLDATFELAGSPVDPRLEGVVTLRGTTEARGTLTADRGGVRLTLAGDELDATAALDAAGWRAEAVASGLPLDDWLPAVREPRLDARAAVSAGWGARPQGRVSEWTLRADGGTVSGSAELDGGFSVTAEVDADLGEALGGGASGRLTGPLSVRAAPGVPPLRAEVSGALRADEVRIGDATVDGTVGLGGSLPLPDVRADLRLGGPVEGALQLGWRPGDERVDLTSDLVVRTPQGAWSSDLRIAGPRGGLVASGRIVTPAGALRASSDGAAVQLDGADDLTGVQLVLRPFPGDQPGAQARVPLATLSDAAVGELRLALDPGAERWLDGALAGGGVAGVTLPDLTLEARGAVLEARAGAPPEATANASVDPSADASASVTRVDARLNLLDLDWSLAVRDLELPDAGSLDVDASGSAATGAAELRLAGPDGGTLVASASTDAAALRLTATGAVRGGAVDLDLRRAAGSWNGQVDVGALPTPAGTLSASGTVGGQGPWPDAELEVRLDGPVAARGSATLRSDPSQATGDPAASRSGSTPVAPSLAVALTADLPGAQPLALTGDVWPRLDLRIAGDAGEARLRAPAWSGEGPWRLSGATTVELPGVSVTLRHQDGVPQLRLAPGALQDGTLVAELPAAPPLQALAAIGRDGLTATGDGRLEGTVAWRPALNADVRALSYGAPFGTVGLDGTVRNGVADLTGRFRPSPAAGLPGELIGRSISPDGLTFALRGGLDEATLTIDDAADAADTLAARLVWSGDRRTARLTLAGGGASADLTLAPDAGLTGSAELRDLLLRLPGGLEASVDGDVSATGAAAEGRLELSGPGRATLDGRVDLLALLPAGYRPAGAAQARATEASIRISELQLSALPGVERLAPRATGGINAVIELRGSRVLAQIAAPELRAGGRAVPLRIEGAGDLGAGGAGVGFSGTWAGSPLQGSADLERLQLLWTLERFPLQAPIEARVGPLDVDAEATGVLRLELPWRAPGTGSVRFATERIRLERSGVVTTGTFAADARAGRVTVNAAFEGVGRWEAEGTIARDELDFVLRADQADATPLLGLIPALSRLNAGARGDLTVEAHGSPGAPVITARTQDLELALAGARYRLTETDVALDGADLSVNALISGVQPVGGRLRVAGDARLRLNPWRLEGAGLQVDGDLSLPVIGEVSELTGDVRADERGRPYLDVTGRIGAPLGIEGTLWPLDLRAAGEGLSLRAPTLLLDDSTSDLDLRLRYDELFRLSGRVAASDGRFVLGIRPPAGPPPDDRAARRSALSRFVFDDLSLVGRQLSFSENFGSAVFDADLRLAGSAAGPRLSGVATAQRGTFRFSGRDFSVTRGVARFEPSRGAYPVLEVEAVATFDKRDVLASAARGVTFEQPSGPTFEVRLTFEAEVLPTPNEPRPFRLDLEPVLTSNAQVSIPAGEGLTAGTRTLSEAELLSLVALGRLDLSDELAGGGVASGVARSALDNAVDLLILSELQSALSQALGLDLVEIRTSTLSSVLAGDDDPFGVSLRLGGYVGEGLFASYEVGRFADADGDDALSNTLALTYELGPIAFDLATRLDFVDVAAVTPTPELTAGLRYQLTPFLAIEGGASVSTPESEARFGVTLRW